MIHADEHGNKFVVMVDGSRVPMIPATANIQINTVEGDQIMPLIDALAINRTCAHHWYQKYQEAQTIIADLREQLQAKG